MPKPAVSVDQFLREHDHPDSEMIERLRSLVLSANPQITEHIKWNAPSFCYKGDDRVTMRLHPKGNGGVQLVFHREAKVKDSSDFVFADSSGLVKWLAADRGLVAFTDVTGLTQREADLMVLVDSWVRATS